MTVIKKHVWSYLITLLAIILITNCQLITGYNFFDDINSKNNICQGYTLISPRKARSPFLIDMDGNIIHNYFCDNCPHCKILYWRINENFKIYLLASHSFHSRRILLPSGILSVSFRSFDRLSVLNLSFFLIFFLKSLIIVIYSIYLEKDKSM